MGRHNASHGRGGSHQNTHAKEDPKWVDVGRGILQLKKNHGTYIKLAGGRCGAFQSLKVEDVRMSEMAATQVAPTPTEAQA